MNEALATVQQTSVPLGMLSQQTYNVVHQVAESAAAAGLARTADEAFVKMLRGHELGIPMMTALNSIHLVEGKLAYDASFMEGLAQRAPTTERFECTETTEKRCVYVVKRKGWESSREVVWTIEMAQQAGLVDRGGDESKKKMNNWNKYPMQMLRARCKSDAARMVAPEALHGMYCGEELRDGDVMIDRDTGEVKTAPASPQGFTRNMAAEADAFIERIRGVKTDDERKECKKAIRLAEQEGRLSGSHFDRVRMAYEMRWPSPAGQGGAPPPDAGAGGGAVPGTVQQPATGGQ